MDGTPFPSLFADAGFGLGLRTVHYEHVLGQQPQVDWFEVISENFMVPGGNPRRVLRGVRERYPIALHGVSMSLGSADPLNQEYLSELRALADEVEPLWISDHLCWGSIDGMYAHDLLPLPMTEAVLQHVVARVAHVQELLGRRMLIENVSSYVTYRASELSEWEFLAELARRADCGLLVDVNNVYVSGHNHGFDPREYLAALPSERIGQIHLAGHSRHGELLLDTHDHPVTDEVWQLYRYALELHGPRSTLIEWDENLPTFDRLERELQAARAVAAGEGGHG